MKAEITHNRNKAKPIAQRTFGAKDGRISLLLPTGSEVATVFIGPGGTGRIEVFGDTEPEPIPMGEMVTGDVGQVVSWRGTDMAGRFIQRIVDNKWVTLDGNSVTLSNPCGIDTVRLLQPGEELTISVVKDDVGDNGVDDSLGFPVKHGEIVTQEPEPQTLDDALRTGTAEEIVAAAGCGWYKLRDTILDAVPTGLEEVFASIDNRLRDRGTERDDNTRDLAAIFVEIRDRLRLFGEVKNATD